MQLHIWYHQLNHSNSMDYYITKQVQQFSAQGFQEVSLDFTLSAIDDGHQASVRLNADGHVSYLQADSDNLHHAVDNVLHMVDNRLRKERSKDGLDALLPTAEAC
jgi:ribosome-associated translation inhibitor RaiA